MTRADLALAETLAERTARLRALRLAGVPPEPTVAGEPTCDLEPAHDLAKRLLTPTAAQRAAFVIECWGDGETDTYDIARYMRDEFGIAVTEAEVCKVLRRHGEDREPWIGGAA